MKAKISVFVLGLTLSMITFAENAKFGDDIDRTLAHCQDKAVSTQDMLACNNQAIDGWNKALNRQYQLLLKGQPEPVAEPIRQSQRDWVQYRDSYFSAMNAFYQQQEGTIWSIVASGRKLDVIRSKAIDLNQLLTSLNLQ